VREVSDTIKKVKVIGFAKAAKAIKVIKTITSKVVYIRPFCYI